MSHVLGLLFEYYRYQQDTIMRVYADDLLVDEILLTKDIPLRAKKWKALPPFNDGKGTGWPEVPEKLFLFEIDQKHLTRSIRIQVLNDNNNHTNGFMTKFSYVIFHGLFLVPQCLLYQNNWRRIGRFVNNKWDNTDASKITDKEFNFFPWRGPRYEDIVVKSSSNTWEKGFLWGKRGGSFDVQIPLFKKHGQIHIAKPKPGRMDLQPFPFKVLSLFNKLNTST